MRKDYTIFVEGEADEHFIRQLIEFIWKGNTQITPDSIVPTNGYSNLMSMDRQQTYLNTMQRTSDDGGINLIIFDADDDCSARRKEILEWGKKNNARFELFLLPDNSSPGALEDLLERIIYPDNAPIMLGGIRRVFEKHTAPMEKWEATHYSCKENQDIRLLGGSGGSK